MKEGGGPLQSLPAALSGTFKRQHPFEARKTLSAKMRAVYPLHFPLVVERRGRGDPPLPKSRFLVAGEKRVAEALAQIRGEMSLAPHEALFFLARGQMVNPGETILRLHERASDEDGFLYLVYSREDSFGGLGRPGEPRKNFAAE